MTNIETRKREAKITIRKLLTIFIPWINHNKYKLLKYDNQVYWYDFLFNMTEAEQQISLWKHHKYCINFHRAIVLVVIGIFVVSDVYGNININRRKDGDIIFSNRPVTCAQYNATSIVANSTMCSCPNEGTFFQPDNNSETQCYSSTKGKIFLYFFKY